MGATLTGSITNTEPGKFSNFLNSSSGSSVSPSGNSDENRPVDPNSDLSINGVTNSSAKRNLRRRRFLNEKRRIVVRGDLQQAADTATSTLHELKFAELPSVLKEDMLEEKMQKWPDRLAEVIEAFEEDLPFLSGNLASKNDIEQFREIVKDFTRAIQTLQSITEEVKETYHLIKEQPEFAQRSLLTAAINAILTCIGAVLSLLSHFLPLITSATAIVGPTISLASTAGGFSSQIKAHKNAKYLKIWENVIASFEALQKSVSGVGDQAILSVIINNNNLTDTPMQKTERKLSEIKDETAERIDELAASITEMKKSLKVISQRNQSLEQKITLLERNNSLLEKENNDLKRELDRLRGET